MVDKKHNTTVEIFFTDGGSERFSGFVSWDDDMLYIWVRGHTVRGREEKINIPRNTVKYWVTRREEL